MLTNEQAKQIKQQLLEQVKHFPENKQQLVKDKIQSMDNQELEEFLKENQLIAGNIQQEKQKCIFCAIANNQIESYKIGENQENIAVLEINPLNQGHALVIPLQHTSTLKQSTQSLAREIALKLKKAFSPKDIKIQQKSLTNHAALEIIPITGKETERKQASKQELADTQQKILTSKPENKQRKQTTQKKQPLVKLKPRIP
ncbi:MAG: HIT family protein [Candidatus Nanoarchaeia archaeon]